MNMNMGANKLIAVAVATVVGAAVYATVSSMCCTRQKKLKRFIRKAGTLMYGAGTVMHHLAKSMI